MKFNTRLITYLTLSLLAIVTLQASLLGFFLNNIQQTEQLRENASATQKEAHLIEVTLLSQWFSLKNLFIRGHDPAAYYLHLEEFFENERLVYKSLEHISELLEADEELKESFDNLNEVIRSGSRDYRAAIDAYSDTNINAHIVADRYTTIESLIQADLNHFINLVDQYEKTKVAGLKEDIQKGVYLLLATSLGGGLIILLVLVYFFRSRFIKPLEIAIDTAGAISKGKKDLRIKTPDDPKHKQEFDIFALAFNEMLDSLEQKNSELEQAMQQLANNEKLSSLGSLVAGVSHELNTPIGVALTGSSCLGDRSFEIQRAMNNGSITKNQLQTFIDEVQTGSTLIVDNIRIASELIHNFKQVAVDQSSERKRQFNVKVTIEEVLSTLSPTLKKTNHTIDLDLEPTLMMISYPGPLGQVITNLVNNSVLHGFSETKNGVISITAKRLNNHLLLTYKDNGKGMEKDVLKRVFEPFFTTKMGQGGSGLGMHIVHNIVTGILKGELSLTSEVGQGIKMQIDLPLEVVNSDPSE